MFDLAGGAIFVVHADYLAAITDHFGGASAHDDVDVGHGASLLLQHFIGSQGVGELHHSHMLDDASQIDGRLDAGVTTTDHRYSLALEEGAIAVRAVGHALGAVLELTRHIQITPTGTGSQDHGAALQGGARGEIHVHIPIFADGGGTLLGDHFHAVLFDVLLQAGGQFRAFGIGHGDKVLDADGVHHLTTETFGNDGGANAFTSGIDGRCGASRATAHDQHIVGIFLIQLGGLALGSAGVEFGDDLFERNTALAERLAVQVDIRYRHDLTLGDLFLE